ncbi:hypothetical protein ACJIZ3_007162 [Penstemon smallii]|uniref:DOG1 domain-containing protein n=1 Tax=Penstemon smallii TaxID=265156 RepID=A0ABD3SA87_9LAMI
MATFNHDQFQCCFQNWIAQQHEDLDELLSADSKITDHEKLNHLSLLKMPTCGYICGCRPSISVRLVYSEEITDEPLAMLAKRGGRMGESSQDLDRAMDAHSVSLASIMGDADRLRLRTLKDLVGILTPLQTVDLLVATKKLHLSMHEWGKRSDNQIGKPFSWAHISHDISKYNNSNNI